MPHGKSKLCKCNRREISAGMETIIVSSTQLCYRDSRGRKICKEEDNVSCGLLITNLESPGYLEILAVYHINICRILSII